MRIKTGRTYHRGRLHKLRQFLVEAVRTHHELPIDTVRLTMQREKIGPDDEPETTWVTFDRDDINLDPQLAAGVDHLIESLTKLRNGARS